MRTRCVVIGREEGHFPYRGFVADTACQCLIASSAGCFFAPLDHDMRNRLVVLAFIASFVQGCGGGAAPAAPPVPNRSPVALDQSEGTDPAMLIGFILESASRRSTAIILTVFCENVTPCFNERYIARHNRMAEDGSSGIRGRGRYHGATGGHSIARRHLAKCQSRSRIRSRVL